MRTASLVILVVAACGSANHASSPGSSAIAAGPQPVISVALWPDRWPTIAALPQVRALGMPLPTSFWTLAQTAAGQVGLDKLAFPPPGIDSAQPITVEMGAPQRTFEALVAAAAKRDMNAMRGAVGMRIRVTVPAKDAAALAGALEQAIAARKDRHPALHVVRGDHAVAVDIAFEEADLQDKPAPPAIALAFDAGHDSAARAALRLPGLADVSSMTGTLRMVGALAMVEKSEANKLLAAGTSEVLAGYLLMDPATSIADALLFDVPVSGNVQAAFELTEPGKAALAAGGLAPGKRVALDAVKWQAAIDASPHSPLVASGSGKKAESELATLFHECGAFCFAYAAMGNALPFAAVFGGADLGAMIKQATAQLGTPLADIEIQGNLVFLLAAGANPPTWKVPAAGGPQTAAEACYRHALLDVRSALKASSFDAADAALAGADKCVAADPAIAARHRAMRELVLTLRGS